MFNSFSPKNTEGTFKQLLSTIESVNNRLRKSLCKRKDPITGNSFIRVMIINNWMVLIDRESLHTPGT